MQFCDKTAYVWMGILPLKKRVSRDKCSFTTKRRMFGVLAIDEILRYHEPRSSVRALYATLPQHNVEVLDTAKIIENPDCVNTPPPPLNSFSRRRWMDWEVGWDSLLIDWVVICPLSFLAKKRNPRKNKHWALPPPARNLSNSFCDEKVPFFLSCVKLKLAPRIKKECFSLGFLPFDI